MTSRYISRLLASWQRQLLAMLSLAGIAYASLSLIANGYVAYAKRHLEQPDIAMPAFKTGAAIFPLHASFLDAPAFYAIFANANGILSLTDTLREVDRSLQFHPNSAYLVAHANRLRGTPQ